MNPEIEQEDWEHLNIPKFPYNLMQLFFILRLRRLTDLSRTSTVYEDWQGKLLDSARMSTYLDCISQNIKEQADGLLK